MINIRSLVPALPSDIKSVYIWFQMLSGTVECQAGFGPQSGNAPMVSNKTQVANVNIQAQGEVACTSGGDIYFYTTHNVSIWLAVWGYTH